MSVKESDTYEPCEADSAEPEAHDTTKQDPAQPQAVDQAVDNANDKRSARQLRVTISFRSLVVAAVITALVGAVAVLAWLYVGVRHNLDAQARRSETTTHAEKVALDYAVNAAAINYTDINAWKTKLVAGTTPELKEKLTKAAQEMEQILVPLQWISTSNPLVAKVRSDTGGVYVVDCFVSILTKTVQASEPLQSTATYSLTIDSGKNWQISDVGGVGAVVQQK